MVLNPKEMKKCISKDCHRFIDNEENYCDYHKDELRKLVEAQIKKEEERKKNPPKDTISIDIDLINELKSRGLGLVAQQHVKQFRENCKKMQHQDKVELRRIENKITRVKKRIKNENHL